MNDYSQNGEQKIILDYFGGLGGVFLDIGANDGITLSNVRGLYETANWGGIFVEPSPAAFRKLLDNYHAWDYLKADGTYNPAFINAAITRRDGPVDFWESGTHFNKGDVGLLSTTKQGELAKWSHLEDKFTKINVRGITFNTLIIECGQPHFDFISIDCEGTDYEVLSQIDLTAVGCRMLCIETNGKDDDKYIEYSKVHGMKLHASNQHNLIFVSWKS